MKGWGTAGWRHITSGQTWGCREGKQRGWWNRNLKGVETLCDPLFPSTLTQIRSLDPLTPPDSLCLSVPWNSQMPLIYSLNNYVAHMALSVFSPNKISQMIHRFEHTHDSWHYSQRVPSLGESCSFQNKNFPLFTSCSADYSLWHLHSQVTSLWLWPFLLRN